jgi:hypothetical protein
MASSCDLSHQRAGLLGVTATHEVTAAAQQV